MERIGTLRFLSRYPVKGMMGEDLKVARVSRHGITGDRVFAFVDENSQNKKFPWMTARQRNEMILFKPRFLDPSHEFTKVEILTPEGSAYNLPSIEFEEYLQRRFQNQLRLQYSDEGMKDSKPLSMLGLQTLDALKIELGIDLLRHERFRENFYVQWEDRGPYYENELVGKSLKIGEVILKIDKKNGRCVVPTLDPDNAASSGKILEMIKRNHDGCFGVYGVPEREGEVRVGDSVFLI